MKGLRTVRNAGGIIIAIASRQWPTNIAAAGQGIGPPFENARSIDAVVFVAAHIGLSPSRKHYYIYIVSSRSA